MRTRSTWKSGSTRRGSGTYRNTSTGRSGATSGQNGYSPIKFSTHRNEITAKIASFRTINQQFSGAGKVTTFSPTTANKWINFINDGARVYKFSDTQLARVLGTPWTSNATTNNALRLLKKKYGAGIKAVTKGKSSCWLIAATNNVTKRPFSTYTFSG